MCPPNVPPIEECRKMISEYNDVAVFHFEHQCENPRLARPGADSLGIDVYATVRKLGYPIQVLKAKTEPMNRYAFLLIE